MKTGQSYFLRNRKKPCWCVSMCSFTLAFISFRIWLTTFTSDSEQQESLNEQKAEHWECTDLSARHRYQPMCMWLTGISISKNRAFANCSDREGSSAENTEHACMWSRHINHRRIVFFQFHWLSEPQLWISLLSDQILTCWQIVFRTYFAYTSKLAVSMETLRPSDMSSRPAGCDSPEPLSSASPKTTRREQ